MRMSASAGNAPQIREQGQEEHFLTGCGLRRGLARKNSQHVVGQLRQVVQLPHDAADALPVFSLSFFSSTARPRSQCPSDVLSSWAMCRMNWRWPPSAGSGGGHGAERPAQAAYLIPAARH